MMVPVSRLFRMTVFTKKLYQLKRGIWLILMIVIWAGISLEILLLQCIELTASLWTLQTHGLITPHMLGWPLILLMILMIVTGCALLMRGFCLIKLAAGLVLFKSIF